MQTCIMEMSRYIHFNTLFPVFSLGSVCLFSWTGLCLEKRVFYKLISGLHASINLHLCANYLLEGNSSLGKIARWNSTISVMCLFFSEIFWCILSCFLFLNMYVSLSLPFFPLYIETWGKPRWGPNVKEFTHRFDPIETKGEGPRRLKNLYFLYLIELRALSKVAPYFERSVVDLYTGNGHEDAESKALLLDIFRDTK